MTVVLPFKTAPADAVTWTELTASTEEDGLLDADRARWTLGADLHISVSFSVNLTTALRWCGLRNGVPIELALFVESTGATGTRVKQALGSIPVKRSGRLFTSDITVPGNAVGGTLRIVATLRLSTDVPSTPPAPTRRGSILWRQERMLVLQEDADLLRVIPVEESAQPMSLWAVRVDLSDLERPFIDAARITVNTKNPLAAKLVEAERGSDRGPAAQFHSALRHLMIADARRQLIEIALTSDALLEYPYDPDDTTSVAGVLLTQMKVIFNGADPASLRERFLRDPVEITQCVHDAAMKRAF